MFAISLWWLLIIHTHLCLTNIISQTDKIDRWSVGFENCIVSTSLFHPFSPSNHSNWPGICVHSVTRKFSEMALISNSFGYRFGSAGLVKLSLKILWINLCCRSHICEYLNAANSRGKLHYRICWMVTNEKQIIETRPAHHCVRAIFRVPIDCCLFGCKIYR